MWKEKEKTFKLLPLPKQIKAVIKVLSAHSIELNEKQKFCNSKIKQIWGKKC